MVHLGIIDSAQASLSPRIDGELSWEDNDTKEWDARAMAVLAAMIDRMDQGIGRIINALKQNGQLENTLIIFLSDNGASSENAAAYGPGFDRPSETRDGEEIVYTTDKKCFPVLRRFMLLSVSAGLMLLILPINIGKQNPTRVGCTHP